MIFIKYHPENERPQPRNATTSIDGVFLVPGDNTVSSEDYQKLKEHPDYPKYIEWGAIVLAEGSPSPIPIEQPVKATRAKKKPIQQEVIGIDE